MNISIDGRIKIIYVTNGVASVVKAEARLIENECGLDVGYRKTGADLVRFY